MSISLTPGFEMIRPAPEKDFARFPTAEVTVLPTSLYYQLLTREIDVETEESSAAATETTTDGSSSTETTTEEKKTETEEYLKLTLRNSLDNLRWRWPDYMAVLVYGVANGFLERLYYAQRPDESCTFEDETGKAMTITKATVMDYRSLGNTFVKYVEMATPETEVGEVSNSWNVRTYDPSFYEFASRACYDFLKKSQPKNVEIKNKDKFVELIILPPTVQLGWRSRLGEPESDKPYPDEFTYRVTGPSDFRPTFDEGCDVELKKPRALCGDHPGSFWTLADIAGEEAIEKKGEYYLRDALCYFYGLNATYNSHEKGATAKDVAYYLDQIFGDIVDEPQIRAGLTTMSNEIVGWQKYPQWLEDKYFYEDFAGLATVKSLLDVFMARSFVREAFLSEGVKMTQLVQLCDRALYFANGGRWKTDSTDASEKKEREDGWDGGEIVGAGKPPNLLISTFDYLAKGGIYTSNWRANSFVYAIQANLLSAFARWGLFVVPMTVGTTARLVGATKSQTYSIGATVGVISAWFAGDKTRFTPYSKTFGFDDDPLTVEHQYDNFVKWKYNEKQTAKETQGVASDVAEGTCSLEPATGLAVRAWKGDSSEDAKLFTCVKKTLNFSGSPFDGIKYTVCTANIQALMDHNWLDNFSGSFGKEAQFQAVATVSFSVEGEFPIFTSASLSSSSSAQVDTTLDMTGVEKYGTRTGHLTGEPSSSAGDDCYWTVPFLNTFTLTDSGKSIKTAALKTTKGKVADKENAKEVIYKVIKEHKENNENDLWEACKNYFVPSLDPLLTKESEVLERVNIAKKKITSAISGKSADDLFKSIELTETYTNTSGHTDLSVCIVDEDFSLPNGVVITRGSFLAFLYDRTDCWDIVVQPDGSKTVTLHDDGNPASVYCRYAYQIDCEVRDGIMDLFEVALANYYATTEVKNIFGAFKHKWHNLY